MAAGGEADFLHDALDVVVRGGEQEGGVFHFPRADVFAQGLPGFFLKLAGKVVRRVTDKTRQCF